jgi:hypothetical protein
VIDQFFGYAIERHSIYIRRSQGLAPPWTADKALRVGRFTNVYRELDKTTDWFRRYVRGPMHDSLEVLPATVVFRWFNRITTGEAIFCQTDMGFTPPATAWEVFINTGNVAVLKDAILRYVGPGGPFITGAYTINTRSAGIGLTKLDGVLRLIEMWFQLHDWKAFDQTTMEGATEWMRSPCLAEFMGYEIACDLRYTRLLEQAPDRMTWANPGPGAIRGLNRIHGRKVGGSQPRDMAIQEMRDLLICSETMWPEQIEGVPVPRWEMREVEHTLCEFDKYCRMNAGEGQTRGKFNGG